MRMDGSAYNVSVARRTIGVNMHAHDQDGSVTRVAVRMRTESQSRADAGTFGPCPIFLFTTLMRRLEGHDSFADLDREPTVFLLKTSVDAVIIGVRRGGRRSL